MSKFTVLCFSKDDKFIEILRPALDDLLILTNGQTNQAEIAFDVNHQRLVTRIKNTINTYSPVEFNIEVLEKPSDIQEKECPIGVIIVDYNSLKKVGVCSNQLITNILKDIEGRDISLSLSPKSIICYENYLEDSIFTDTFYIKRMLQKNTERDRVDIMGLVMDYIDEVYFDRFTKRNFAKPDRPNLLTTLITQYMAEKYNKNWSFYYYTGSVITSFIRSFLSYTQKNDIMSDTGVSEHALACGAIANWQLFKKSYIITITSGMLDELKGTLVNLRRNGSNGILIIADSTPEYWNPFQGTINQIGDVRKVLSAKDIPYVYITDKTRTLEQLEEVFSYYKSYSGPVAIIATDKIFLQTINDQIIINYHLESHKADKDLKDFDYVVDLINNSKTNILWQVEDISDDERSAIYRIAEKAGIALCDSLTFPGAVTNESNNFLGTMGIYAYSDKVYQFFHTENKLNNFDDQVLFSINGEFGQVSTPFSEGKLNRNINIVQINEKKEYISPYANKKVVTSLKDFLNELEGLIDVSSDIFESRINKIKELHDIDNSLIIESLPMHYNCFFNKLDRDIVNLLNDGYSYRGVYDVGRGGISAVRNTTRVKKGFSGWYGRALMGDALLAIPYISLAENENILAFIGDGARKIIPNAEEHIIERTLRNSSKFENNISVFFLLNGCLSLIQTYYDKWFVANDGGQSKVYNFNIEESSEEINGIQINRFVVNEYCPEQMRNALTKKRTINFFYVYISHDSYGDGVSLISETTWRQNYNYAKREL